jgi:hypothetical protein
VNREDDIEPVVTFNTGGSQQLMLVRACMLVEPFFPSTGIALQLPTDSDGGYGLISMSAFANEPR